MKSLLVLSLFLLLASTLSAEVRLSKVFTPHMVLQRGMAVPVWGAANPGEVVTVTFAGQSKSTKANAQGFWSLKLEPLKASAEPRTLMIGSSKIKDVLVGDVWLGSGQSNMDMEVVSYIKDDPVLAAAAAQTYPQLRLMRKEPNATWEVATAESNAKFSALLFSFGSALQKQTGVPIGLMVGAVSGTPSVYWLTEEMWRSDPACEETIKKYYPNYNYEALVAKYNADMAKHAVDLAAWKKLAAVAQKMGRPPPPEPRAPDPVRKVAGANSGTIGQYYEQFIGPYIGYGIKGVLWDQGESGTNIDLVSHESIMGALINGWRKDWGQGSFPWIYVEKPSGGGCAFDYSRPMNRLAEKFAPLPEKIPAPPHPYNSHVAFEQIMKHKNTHMVISSDLGNGVHPPNKSGYGARAVQVALAVAYDKGNEYLGPQLASHSIQEDKMKLSFKHMGKGLAFKNGDQLQGFMIAGEDKKFVWADAVIESDGVIVSSKDVPHPVAVRYAWSDAFQWANFFNKDGLPAQPFRTDAW
ncbi:MAG: hypothetical protein B7Z37_10970 [Verrucomicrobia bacterium 12-59-8]|nr:MAG: hypothetical protein B7Z37_10970 [Verrucomicrobia bacterium 12-59-8]